MILVGDSGSTKTSWCLIDETKGDRVFKTEGYNPFFVDATYITASLKRSIPSFLNAEDVSVVNYYGAGIHDISKIDIIEKAFSEVFFNAELNITHDLLAAARATLGNEPGLVSILGTGTNSGIYDGEVITRSIGSGGFIIGDEGSGAHIGKQLISDYIRGYLPKALNEKFTHQYNIGVPDLLNSIYSKPLPNRYLASYSEFVGEHIYHEYCYDLVKSSFTDFFESLISHYPSYKTYSFNCIGSIGYTFRGILEETASDFGMKTGRVIASPLSGLVQYHSVLQHF